MDFYRSSKNARRRCAACALAVIFLLSAMALPAGNLGGRAAAGMDGIAIDDAGRDERSVPDVPTRGSTLVVPDGYATIQAAVDAASPGDTVYVRAGTYPGSVLVAKTINLTGEDRNTTIMDGQGAAVVLHVTAQMVNVSGFNITDGQTGLYLEGGGNSTVTENNVFANTAYGIRVNNSNDNTIVHNNFISNAKHAWDNGTNNWNSTYFQGGNYWSDKSSPDALHGPLQDQAGADGIHDSAYTIGSFSGGDLLTIVFVQDVRTGDASVIISPSGEAMIIDAGHTNTGGATLNVLANYSITQLKYTVVTHYHEDHLGGMDEVINGLGGNSAITDACYDRGYSYSTSMYDDYVAAAGPKRATISKYQVLDLGGGVTLTCVGVNEGLQSHENEVSVCLRLDYGDFNIFFGGDIGGYDSGSHEDIESQIMADVGECEVYQVNHHGSQSSSNPSFLATMDTMVAVFSAGSPNGNDHPSQAAYDRVKAQGGYMYFTTPGDYPYDPGGGAANIQDPADGKIADEDITLTTDGTEFTIMGDDYVCRSGAKKGAPRNPLNKDYYPFTQPDGWLRPVVNMDTGETFLTIGLAEYYASSGEEIFATAGTYDERVSISKPLTLTGAGAGQAVINAGGIGDAISISSDWVNVSGFTLTGSGAAPGDSGLQVNGMYCTVSQVNVSGNEIGVFLSSSAELNTLSDCELYSNGVGVFAQGSNNTIYHNNFKVNSNHTVDSGNNTWNLTYPIGGNYFDNWTSPDGDADGFVDNPFVIPSGGGGGGEPLDIGNYYVNQYDAAKVTTISPGTTIDPGGYVVICRNADQASF